jgi:hypothetical protein
MSLLNSLTIAFELDEQGGDPIAAHDIYRPMTADERQRIYDDAIGVEHQEFAGDDQPPDKHGIV